MPYKNNTREGIHSGLSQSKDDQKWSDMLNFRCSTNRTFVVPRRVKLLECDAGFHTVVHGLRDVNYVIGTKSSWMFRGQDGSLFSRLWRARLERETTTSDQSEQLKIRGNYLGTKPVNIRLTVVDGRLVLDNDWPVTPEPVVEPTPVISLNCGVNTRQPQLTLLFVNALTQELLSGIEFSLYQGVELILSGTSNANGAYVTNLASNSYRVLVDSVEPWDAQVLDFVKDDLDQEVTVGLTIGPELSMTLFALPQYDAWAPIVPIPAGFFGSEEVDGAANSFPCYLAMVDIVLDETNFIDFDTNHNTATVWCQVFSWGGTSGVWEVGNLRYDGGVIAKCKLAQDSITQYEFDPSDPANFDIYWDVLTTYTEPVPQILNTSITYSLGTLVRVGNTVYECILTHQNYATTEPGVGATWETYWADVTSTSWVLASGATLTIYQNAELVTELTADANGLAQCNLLANTYSIDATYLNHALVNTQLVMPAVEHAITINIP